MVSRTPGVVGNDGDDAGNDGDQRSMTRFGDFTLHEDLGRSSVADRYKATHATQGGPFFLKVYSRLPPTLHGELLHRCESLIGKQHPNLARHLGHGVVDGLPFVVAPYLEGIDLAELSTSLIDRRVNIGLESVLLVLADLTTAVGALHSFAPANNGVPFMGHGDVSLHHVRTGPDGQIWLTGLTTPRGEGPGRPPEGRWDIAGVGALVYDLVPLLRGGATRPPLPVPFDRVVRRALGIGPAEERIAPPELVERLDEVGRALKLKPDRNAFAELVRRTVRVVEKRLQESGGRPVSQGAPAWDLAGPSGSPRPPAVAVARRTPADAIPSLDPVDSLPTLEPLARTPPRPAPLSGPPSPPATSPVASLASSPRSSAGRPAPVLDLEPLPVGVGTPLDAEGEAKTELVERPRPPAPHFEAVADPTAGGRGERAVPPPRTPPRPTTQPRLATPPPAIIPSAAPPPAPLRSPPPSPTPRFDDPTVPVADARMPALPRTATPVEVALDAGPSPFGDLPPDLDDVPPAKRAGPGRQPPPLPPRPAPPPAPSPAGRRPLLVDPPEAPRAAPPPPTAPPTATPAQAAPTNAALVDTTRDATDPDQRSARTEKARRDPGVTALVKRGLVTEAALTAAVEAHVGRGGRLLEILVAQGALTDAAVADALSAEAGRPRLPDQALRTRTPPTSLVRRLPQTYLLARRVLPLSLEKSVLAVAVADPFDLATLDELKSLVGAASVESFVASRAALTAATVEAYRAIGIGGVPGIGGDAPRALLCTPDDTKATRIGARLAQEGIRVEHVLDGDAAREILQTRPPDVVLCAHDVTGQGVTALLLQARSDPRSAELPFFVFGPRGDEELATRILDLGADDFFGEPLKLEMILAKIRRAVGKNRALSGEGWALNDPSGVARILTAPPAALDERSAAAPSVATTAPVPTLAAGAARTAKSRSEPSFLDQIEMPSLDDLPELPPDFGEDVAPEVPAMPTGVMGTLRQMALPEIVQSLEMGRKTARVDLVPAEGDKGMIAFETGQIRYAECGALRGDDAFYQLARHKEGFFRIHYGDKPPDVNIEHPTTFLLLEAMRRMDEEGAVPES